MRPSRVLALILVILAFPTATVWAQQKVYGCVKNNNGQIRIVAEGTTCLPSEHPVEWAAATTGSEPAPSTVTAPLSVFDDGGTVLGLFVSPNYAAREIDGLWVGLPLTAAGGFYTTSVTRYYQFKSCAGDPYMQVDLSNVLRIGRVMTNPDSGNLTFWYPSTLVDAATLGLQSSDWFDGTTWQCTDLLWQVPGSWLFGKIATLDVSAFQAPFRIRQ